MRYLSLLFALLILYSCTEAVIEKPENLIPEDTMVDIYFDISLFNASKNSGYDKLSEHAIDSWDYLFKKYSIDSTQLASSGIWYASKPLVYESIYEKVELRLDSLKKAFDDQISTIEQDRAREAVKSDSIRMAREEAAAMQDSVRVDSTVTDSVAIDSIAVDSTVTNPAVRDTVVNDSL